MNDAHLELLFYNYLPIQGVDDIAFLQQTGGIFGGGTHYTFVHM